MGKGLTGKKIKRRGLVPTVLKGYDTLTADKNAHASLVRKILKRSVSDLPHLLRSLKGRSFQHGISANALTIYMLVCPF
jgi:hypothetical protein